mmetsp:Transcript_25964/g.22899  ORF Transcript_25964/g.22899 Transcript_25964/m.22899 type:complete len:118 (+) Transcript_25964:50-403(+)
MARSPRNLSVSTPYGPMSRFSKAAAALDESTDSKRRGGTASIFQNFNSSFVRSRRGREEWSEESFAEHLSVEEKLIFQNEVMRKRYFTDGACMLKFVEMFDGGDILGEQALFHEIRS